MLIPSYTYKPLQFGPSLSRRVNANSQLVGVVGLKLTKLIKKGEC